MLREDPEQVRDARQRVHKKGKVEFGLALLVMGIMAVAIGLALIRAP